MLQYKYIYWDSEVEKMFKVLVRVFRWDKGVVVPRDRQFIAIECYYSNVMIEQNFQEILSQE